MYKDINGNIKKIKYDVGDGIFFKGKFTHHGVDKSNDINTIRYVISYQYTTNQIIIIKVYAANYQTFNI